MNNSLEEDDSIARVYFKPFVGNRRGGGGEGVVDF